MKKSKPKREDKDKPSSGKKMRPTQAEKYREVQRKIEHEDSMDAMIKCRVSVKNLAPFPDVPSLDDECLENRDRQYRLKVMLRACQTLYDYGQEDYQATSKRKKTLCLQQISEHLSKEPTLFNTALVKETFRTVCVNIFRGLPHPPDSDDPQGWNPDEDNILEPAAFQQTELCYIILGKILEPRLVPVPTSTRFLDRRFIFYLINNFFSPDVLERQMVRVCLHRINYNHVHVRKHILQQISHVLLEYIFIEERCYGIKELMESVGSIVSGFKTPIKDSNLKFYRRVILPLHKCINLHRFIDPLHYVMAQFLEKEPSLAEEAFEAIIRYWPVHGVKKQIHLFAELTVLCKLTPPTEFLRICHPVIDKLASGLQSSYLPLSEKSLIIWNDPYFVALMVQNTEILYPIVMPYLFACKKNHWHPVCASIAETLIDLFKNLDLDAFNDAYAKHDAKKHAERKAAKRRPGRWQYLEGLVKAKKVAPASKVAWKKRPHWRDLRGNKFHGETASTQYGPGTAVVKQPCGRTTDATQQPKHHKPVVTKLPEWRSASPEPPPPRFPHSKQKVAPGNCKNLHRDKSHGASSVGSKFKTSALRTGKEPTEK